MNIQANFSSGAPVTIAILGDSCGCGFGANPGINRWTDGNSYGAVNKPGWGPNWEANNPHSINTSGPVSQAVQDSKQIPSAYHLLRQHVESVNPESKVYNRSASGWTCYDHYSSGSIAVLAAKDPKPEVVIIALGINSAKNKTYQGPYLRALISQCIANGMEPVISKGHNVACDPATGKSTEALPSTWGPMLFWLNMRSEMESIAAELGLQTIDPGSPDNALDISLLYDPFHPSQKGHRRIFEAYREWLGKSVIVGGHRFSHNPNGEVLIGDVRVKLGGNGPVRINTGSGVAAIK